jgi:hypothetical protein
MRWPAMRWRASTRSSTPKWGDTRSALSWLGTAERLHDPMLQDVNSDPLYDPLRNEPEFRALLQHLNFMGRGRGAPRVTVTPDAAEDRT